MNVFDFNLETKIKSIDFMLHACKHRIKRMDHESNLEIKHLKSGFRNPDDDEKKKIVSFLKSRESNEYHSSMPITFRRTEGYPQVLFEFNAFVVDLIACINHVVNLKLRLLDKYDGSRSMSIGEYCTSKKYKKHIKDQSTAHKIIVEDYKRWIKPLNHFRNELVHKIAEGNLYVTLQIDMALESDSDPRIKNRVILHTPFLGLQKDIFELKSFWLENICNLEIFVEEVLKECGISRDNYTQISKSFPKTPEFDYEIPWE